MELHPPRDLEDLRAFTAVDLLLGRRHDRRKRRRVKRSQGNSFVLYLGSRNVSETPKEKKVIKVARGLTSNSAAKCCDLQASGDYIGMALRNNALHCVYKLAGTVHRVETSQLTPSSVSASAFDRVVLRR